MHDDSGMKAGELCIRDVMTACADESVIEAARRMAVYDVGDLIVVHDKPPALPRPIGIITDRDLVLQVLVHPERVSVATIGEVMCRELVVAGEHEDVESVIAKMRKHGVRRIPIVDEAGGLQGVISIDDILGWMRDQIQTTTTAIERQGLGPRAKRVPFGAW